MKPIYPKSMNTVKRVLKSEVIVIQAYLKKKISNNLTFYLKELEKEQSPNSTEEIK